MKFLVAKGAVQMDGQPGQNTSKSLVYGVSFQRLTRPADQIRTWFHEMFPDPKLFNL